MKYLINIEGDHILCGNCNKRLNDSMEIEYSVYLTEFFCSPDCATTRYYDYMGSRPVVNDTLPDKFKFKELFD